MTGPRRTTAVARAWRRLRGRVLARRRLLAAVLAGIAVLAAVRAHAAPPPPPVPVLTAARDLPAGAVVAAGDVTSVELLPDSVPSGVLRHPSRVVGRTIAGPVRAGEPLTDVRLVQGDLLSGYPGRVAAPVRIGDPGVVELLRVGDRVSLVAADPQGEDEPVEAASGVPVVAIPRLRSDASGLLGGALIVVAVPPETARRLAGLATSAYLHAVIVR